MISAWPVATYEIDPNRVNAARIARTKKRPVNSSISAAIVVAIAICGCAGVKTSLNLEEALLADGYQRLSSEDIDSMIRGNTLNGKFGSSKATVFLSPDGTMRGKTVSVYGAVSTDQGTWTVSSQGLFCDTWNQWRAGTDCDHVFVRGREFVLINLDGTKSSEGQIENGNSRGL